MHMSVGMCVHKLGTCTCTYRLQTLVLLSSRNPRPLLHAMQIHLHLVIEHTHRCEHRATCLGHSPRLAFPWGCQLHIACGARDGVGVCDTDVVQGVMELPAVWQHHFQCREELFGHFCVCCVRAKAAERLHHVRE